MRTLVPLFKHFIEDLTQFCYRITDYYKEIKDKQTRVSVENALRIIKRTPTVISNILQDKSRRATLTTDRQLAENIRKFVTSVKSILNVLRAVDVESATRYLELVLHASIAVAGETGSNRRQSISSICKKILRVRSELGKLFAVTSKTAQSWNTINHLTGDMSEQFSELNRVLSQTYKSSEHVTEQSRPLMNLKSAAQRSVIPNDPELDQYIERFKQHANRLMDITEYAVQVSEEGDENIPILRKIAHDISVLGPKIIACALSVHAHPEENVTLAFMNAMCEEWSRMVTRLLAIIDNLTNTGEFLRATEGHITKDMALSKQAFIDQDSKALQKAAKAMVNRAQRVFHVGQKELLKSTSAVFSDKLEGALGELEHALPRIIALVQAAGENFDDINTQEELAAAAHDVAKAVHAIKTIVCGDTADQGDQVTTQTDATKRFASALRSESGFFDIGVQTYPENMTNGTSDMNPPDILLQFAMKDESLDPDDIQKLVGASGIRKPPASINEAIISLADLITTALKGESPESAITVLAAHCGRIRDLSVQCHNLSENKSRLRTIDFLVREMDKLTPSVNDAARKTAHNTQDVVAIENLRWSARHWADSVIVLGKAFDDFGLGPPAQDHNLKIPSIRGLLSAAAAGDRDMVEAEIDSLSLRTQKQVDLAGYCSAACLNSTIAQQIDETAEQLEDVLAELARTAREIEKGEGTDEFTMSQMEHLSEKWRELYGDLCTLVANNQPDTIPSEHELGIPPSKVNIAIDQLVTAARAGDRNKVQVLGNNLSAMATKVRRVSKPIAERSDEYQRDYINETNKELLELTPELLKYGLLVAADPHNNEYSEELDSLAQRWSNQMIALSNALDAAAEEEEEGVTREDQGVVKEEEVEVEMEDVQTSEAIAPVLHRRNTNPQDLREPIEAVGYRLIRQGSLRETEEAELKEIKSVTTKLCDCLQVLCSTHHDVNERYEMEDSIESVRASVNTVQLGRPGELGESVTEWLNSITIVKDHLNKFLDPLLEIVSTPSNKEQFASAPHRVESLVTSLRDVVHDLERAVQLGLVKSERDRDDITLVTVTMDHLEGATPQLLDAIKVILGRPEDAAQRTKFEAIKYQWGTKLKLLTIALDDVLLPHCDFPVRYEDRASGHPMDTVDSVLASVDRISEPLSEQEFSGLASKHITRLLTHKDCKLPDLDVAEFVSLRVETCFAVYLLNTAVEETCSNVCGMIPALSRDILDVSSVEFDGERLGETTEEAIDAVRLISERVTGGDKEVSQMKASMVSLVSALTRITDAPTKEFENVVGYNHGNANLTAPQAPKVQVSKLSHIFNLCGPGYPPNLCGFWIYYRDWLLRLIIAISYRDIAIDLCTISYSRVVILGRPEDAAQRTKFEAIKYQWGTKLKLLTIALDDVLLPHCDFPVRYEDRASGHPMDTVDSVLTSVDRISEPLSEQEFSGLASKHITRLLTHKDCKLPDLDVAEFVSLRVETCFAVYLLNTAVEETCSNVCGMIPALSRDILDVSSVEFDGERLGETTEEAIDAVRLISERVTGGDKEVSQMKASMVSLVSALTRITDAPTKEVVLEFKTSYTDWLCKVKALAGDTKFDTSIYEMSEEEEEVEDGPALLHLPPHDEEGVRSNTFRSDLSGSQTFDELHFSDNEGESRTPEPTFVPPIISEEDEGNLPDECGPLELGTTEDPRQSRHYASDQHATFPCIIAESCMIFLSLSISISLYLSLSLTILYVSISPQPTVCDVAAVVSEKALALEEARKGQGRTERTLSETIQDLDDELAPWETEQNDILLSTKKLLQQFLLIIGNPENNPICLNSLELLIVLSVCYFRNPRSAQSDNFLSEDSVKRLNNSPHHNIHTKLSKVECKGTKAPTNAGIKFIMYFFPARVKAEGLHPDAFCKKA
eukprot:sb/3460614/